MFQRKKSSVVAMPQEMVKAIDEGDLVTVKKIIAKHPGDSSFLNAKDKHGNSALLKSLRQNHPDIAEFLLGCPNIDINIIVWDDHLDTGRICSYGLIPITLAMKKGYLNLVNIMLQHPKLNVNAYSYYGLNILEFSCHSNKQHYVKQLLCHPKINLSWIDDMADNIFKWVYQHLSRSSFNKLVSLPDVVLHVYGNDPIEEKSYRFSHDYTHTLRELFALPDFYIDETLILLAAKTGQLEMLQLLLNDPRFSWQAKCEGGKNLLMLAAEQDLPELVKILLLTKKFDVNAQDEHGNTALILAAMKHEDALVINLLLAAGADRTIMNHRGRNAVMEASGAGHNALCPRLQIAPISVEEYQQFLMWRQQQLKIAHTDTQEFSPNSTGFRQEI